MNTRQYLLGTSLVAISATFMGAHGQQQPITTQAVNLTPELGPVTQLRGPAKPTPTTDLMISNVGFTPGGRVSYTLQNRGRNATASPFVVDIYINLARKDTVKHSQLPALSQQQVISNLARADTCDTVTLRANADSQQLVTEDDEANNSVQRSDTPPCPDLVVEITKDSVNNNLEFRPRVEVTNIGNASTERQFVVFLKGVGGVGIPERKEPRIGPLAPGESQTFYGGKHWGTTRMSYDAFADFFTVIREKNENNNKDSKNMGGA